MPADARHEIPDVLVILETGPEGTPVRAEFAPTKYYYEMYVDVACPDGAALWSVGFANAVPNWGLGLPCDPIPDIRLFAFDPIAEETAGHSRRTIEQVYPDVPWVADLAGPNARLQVSAVTGAEYGIHDYRDDHRTNLFRYYAYGQPAWDSMVLHIEPAVDYDDVMLFTECSVGLVELRELPSLDLVASNACEHDLPAPDLVAGALYQLTINVIGVCQPECMGQYEVDLRGVPAGAS